MDTKQIILKKARELCMKYGIRSVSMDDIAKGCGISKKTIYLHYKGKEELVKELIKDKINNDKKVIESFEEENGDAIVIMLKVADYVVQYMQSVIPSVFYDLQKYYPELWKYVKDLNNSVILGNIKNNIDLGKEQGLYRADVNSDFVAKMYLEMALSVTDEEKFPSSEYEISVLYKSLVRYHFHGILSEKGKAIFNQKEF